MNKVVKPGRWTGLVNGTSLGGGPMALLVRWHGKTVVIDLVRHTSAQAVGRHGASPVIKETSHALSHVRRGRR